MMPTTAAQTGGAAPTMASHIWNTEEIAYINSHAAEFNMTPDELLAAQFDTGLDMESYIAATRQQLAAAAAAAAAAATRQGAAAAQAIDVNQVMATMAQQNAAMLQMFQTLMARLSGAGSIGIAAGSNQATHAGHGLANARLDERCFRNVGKFTNQRGDWKEWRMHFLTAVRECDATFADNLEVYERREEPIEAAELTPTLTQLSAVLQSRLINLTTKESFDIVAPTHGMGWKPGGSLLRGTTRRLMHASRHSSSVLSVSKSARTRMCKRRW